MMSFFQKLQAPRGKCPPAPALLPIFYTWLGGLIAISSVAWLAHVTGYSLILGSFGASCVLLFGFPESPFSQPRNVIGGHVLASLTGLIFLSVFGAHWWSIGLATATAIAGMLVTRTTHPPAGSNPIIIMLLLPSWEFLLTPTLLGSSLLVMVAIWFNNVKADRVYPTYWW